MTFSKNKKYRDILTTAKELFFRHGTKRVTIDEICSEAKVSKMTFYKFFENKNDLAKQILKKIFEETISEYQELMAKEISFKEKIEEVILMKIEKNNQYGDIFFQELLKTNEELKNYIIEKKRESYNLTRKFFINGQKEGVFRKSLSSELFMYFIDHLTEMLDDERFKAIAPDIHKRLEELLNFFFYGLAENKM